MAKKKKKKGPQPHPSNNEEIANRKETNVEKSTPDEECCSLELKLRRSAESKTASSAPWKLDSSPILSIDEIDAIKIQLQNNDPVILFLKEPNKNDSTTTVFAGAFICKVEVSVSSIRTPDKNAKRKSHVTPGTCTFQPSHLLDSILDKPELHTPDLQTPPRNPPPSTPQSTPKSGFSFAKGGGGDVLINSPPSSAKSSYASPQAKRDVNKSSLSVWIVPLKSTLGKDIESVLCQSAKCLHIQIQDEMESSRLPNCSRILVELFLAQTAGRYIHETSTVVISFRGKPLKLRMDQVEAEKAAIEARNDLLLELEMENLEIQDEFPDEEYSDFESQLWKRLRSGLEDKTKMQHLSLYKANRDTQVNFFCGERVTHQEDNNERPTGESTTAAAPLRGHVVVAALSSTLDRLQSFLLTPLLKPAIFARGSLKAPRGVLLHGSSGVGKTSLARQLALDLERDYPTSIRVRTVNCASLQSYSAQIGEAEQRLVRIFEMASSQVDHNSATGTLLIFDDIHLICPKRNGYNPGSDRLAATLLGLLDGIGSATSGNQQQNGIGGAISNSIVILAITSDPSTLDPALRRPGRLDFEVEVPGPDNPKARAEIIQFHLDDLGSDCIMPELTSQQYRSLGEMAKGFNGADCMLAVKEAIRSAISRDTAALGSTDAKIDKSNSVRLTLADLESAIRITKPSAIKSITVEIPTVLWSSIGGMETVKEQLREAIELPETHGHLFEQLRIPPPKGILLYGPPGCSKTLMARALATEGKMNFLAVKGPELLSKWLGESERALASLFRRARVAAPSIVFFDEVDAIAAERGSGGIGTGGGRLLSQLLTELDGINSTGGVALGQDSKKKPRVVVVAATNRPDLIDSALMRPGRIDKKIYVGVPDEKSRHKIFEIGLKGRACANDIDLLQLAKEEVSGGFSGAELIAVCKDAALLALEEDETSSASHEMPSIKMRHLLRSINGMQRQITPEMIDFYESFRTNNR